ncbi:MAG: PilN domain-containing protein [Candidatus Thiodiazotropha sp. (ex Lucinoma borealis)]|nr:PilN domain-containing protein [Candidatus Thiodiazotropha sp. (ex Lucinoma borealis)]
MLDGVAGQEIGRLLRDQLIDPVMACLASRFGRSSDSGCRLTITPALGIFHTASDQKGIKLPSADTDLTRLKPYLHNCSVNNRRRIRIELDPQLLMIRDIRLPLVAKKNLQNVLSYEMDRLSPFSSEQVYFHFKPLEQDEKRGWIKGRLIVAQKSRLDPWYALLNQLAVEIESVTLVGDASPLTLKPRNDKSSGVMGGKLNTLMSVGLMALLVVALVTPIWQQRQIAIDLENTMRLAQKKAADVMQLQENLSQRRDAVGMVSSERESYLAMSEVLLELTRVIPAGSWTRKVILSQEQVNVTGESDQAAELISLLERTSLFEAVRFKSPVVQNRRNGKEVFDLTMQLTRERVQ